MDLTNYYISLLENFRSVRLAEQELRRQMDDDPELQRTYAAWCEEHEYEPKEGLKEFGSQYIQEREERWQTLNDYDDLQ